MWCEQAFLSFPGVGVKVVLEVVVGVAVLVWWRRSGDVEV